MTAQDFQRMDIIEQHYHSIMAFIKLHGVNPNSILIGNEQYWKLLANPKTRFVLRREGRYDETLLGCKLIRVITDGLWVGKLDKMESILVDEPPKEEGE